MKYRDLHIQTQREFPNNARTEGFGWLVRAGYVTRENEVDSAWRIRGRSPALTRQRRSSFFFHLSLPTLSNADETYFPISTGSIEVIHCPSLRIHRAATNWRTSPKSALSAEEPLPLEKVSTPDCHTIEVAGKFPESPKEKTAKAMMFTRVVGRKIHLRGHPRRHDPQRSRNSRNAIGEVKFASQPKRSNNQARRRDLRRLSG